MSGKESSTVVLFRALVLLACLVLVPAAAILGSACPDLIKSTLVDRLSGLVDSIRGATTKAGPTATDQSAADEQLAHRAAAPAWPSGRLPTASIAASHAAAEQRPLAARSPVDNSPRAPLPAGGADRALAGGVGSPGAAPPWPAAALASAAGERRAQPASYAELTGHAADAPGRAPLGPRGELPAADRFAAIERRLRQAGATYYLLETHGKAEYRFHCQVAAPRGGRPRHFEVVDRDPLAAMTRIADDIEAWRAGR